MQGTFDEASLRLAKALRRPPEHVEAALQEVGVDAPYLSRALVEGDPQGAIDAVSARLGLPARELVLAIVRASAEADPRRFAEMVRASDASSEALAEFLGGRLPVLLRRAALAALLGGLALAAFAGLALWDPALFRALLVYAVAGLLALGALGLLAAAWRMQRAAATLRRLRGLERRAKR